MSLERHMFSYTVKKMTNIEDERLEGRYPEFARMSRVPGIGIEQFIKYCTSNAFTKACVEHGDPEIPRVVRIAGKVYPVSYYLRKTASDITGLPIMSEEKAQLWREKELEAMEIRDQHHVKAKRVVQNRVNNLIVTGKQSKLEWLQVSMLFNK